MLINRNFKMITKSTNPKTHGNRFSWLRVLWFAAMILIFATEAYSQNYEITINQRRMGDQIGVEFWIKSLNTSAPNLGNASLSVLYNTDLLQPAALGGTNPSNATNYVDADVNQATPYVAVTSPFSNASYNYSSLTGQAADASNGTVHPYVFTLDVNLDANGVGFMPATTGNGTFIGMLKFDIINFGNLTDNDNSMVAFNPYDFVGNIEIFDASGTSQKANTVLTDPADFKIRGLTILNPNGPNQAVNRYPEPAYLSLTPNKGYPVYFERSGLLFPGVGTEYGTSRFAYMFEYSLDGGSAWSNIGRVAEDRTRASLMANKDYNRSGEIDSIDGTSDYFITQGDGTQLPVPTGDGYGGVLRIVWKANSNFPYRSEQAKLKVTQLDSTGTGADIDSRNALTGTGRWDVSDYTFVLGRLFFAQLDGTSTYFKSQKKYSNATQLTVEAWVNLNGINVGDNVETGIVASSGGAASPEEGAWMLYLADGKYPAFRAREIEGRGTGGYIATVVSPEELAVTSASSPIPDAHADNWVHLAATVQNNVITLFVNGEKVAQQTNTQAVNIRMLTTDHPIWVGVNPNGGIEATDYLYAGIKEVRVWRLALTQDQLRSAIPGVYDVANPTANNNDVRTALELAYSLQGTRLDIASDVSFQNGTNHLNYYNSPSLTASAVNSLINYRPDRSHIRLTSPVGGEGVINLIDNTFPVRWVAYGIGSTAPNSYDVQVMWSRNGGALWVDALDDQGPSLPLDRVEVESGQALWEPYNNITNSGDPDDLQGVVDIDANYAKTVRLRISGTEARGQDNIYDVSGDFIVAPYFALSNTGSSVVSVPGSTSLNMTGATGYIEAWVRPYRYPTAEEGFFPIVSKTDSTDGNNFHYSFRMLSTGQLEFRVGSTTGDAVRIAQSDAAILLEEPNVLQLDSAWTHVGVWFNLANGTGASSVKFYIDGTVQNTDAISTQLGSDITVDNMNVYPTFIAYEPGLTTDASRSFIGEVKSIRFWGNNPGGQSHTGNEPTALSKFIQGALTVRAPELGSFSGIDYTENLLAAFTFNGGSFIQNGFWYGVSAYPSTSGMTALIKNKSNVSYAATRPYLKAVEPVYKQAVANTTTNLKVRWVGFDYNRNNLASFRNGSDAVNHADVEYSILGGGGLVIQPYQYVASEVYNASYTNAMTLPTINSNFEFPGTTDKSQFGLQMNLSVADPDISNDGTYNDQGPIAATMTNGRFRLQGRATINGITLEYENGGDGDVPTLRTESPLFNITPPSNFTVRTVLEGYHVQRTIQNDLGNTYDTKGVQIKLFTNNANMPGTLVDQSVSTQGYASTNALDPTSGTGRFNDGSDYANIPFVFTELDDGRYFVVVEHLNHLPVMSKYAAPFYYAGDDATTWDVESGWDFQNWDGSNAAITEAEAATNPPTIGNNYTAYGNFETDENNSGWAATALNYNDGQPTPVTHVADIAAMVGGDTYKDGQINAADRVQVRFDAGGSAHRSDVSGDGFVNATDRNVVDRNNNKVSSLTSLPQVSSTEEEDIPVPMLPYLSNADPMTVIHPEAPEMSQRFIDDAQAYLDNGGSRVHFSKPESKIKDQILAGTLRYRVTGMTERKDDFVYVNLYIENLGGDWGMGNATFGIQYEPGNLKFAGLQKNSEVIFSDRGDLGYGSLFTNPEERTKDPISDIRTIDVDYDAYTMYTGQTVPQEKTYLGTLKFKIINEADFFDFKWHDITVVYSTTSDNVTGYGIFDPIEPIFNNKSAFVTIPNGGEDWRSGRLYSISWTEPSKDVMVWIDFSADGGATWTRINEEPVSSQNMSYNWKTPRINSAECLVRLIDVNTGNEVDRSDATFALLPAPAEITRPASADPIYKGGIQDMIQWYVEDPANVRFEFSENGSTGWSTVTAVVNAQNSEIDWILPAVNSKNAVVRMVNVETGEVITVSEKFKILAGAVNITTPRKGDKLKINENKTIRWTYDNVNNFDMQVSYDAGATWQTLANNVNALNRSYDWMVPDVKTENAHIRAIWNNDPEMEYHRTPDFAITGLVSVDKLTDNGFGIGEPVPNPFTGETNISFTLPTAEKVVINVYDSRGMKVMTLINGVMFQAGTHSVKLSGIGLPAGLYFVQLNAGTFNQVKEAVHIK